MIQSLYIKNYVLIDELDMQFSEGFTTITGETGAGKSILMGALSLILGQRVDTSVLKLKDAKCIVEGSFSPGEAARAVFDENDLDFEDLSIIRREIAPGGKSRAFINDTPVNLQVLREVGNRLVDIHSQHQNLQLSEHRYQLDVIDYLAHNGSELAAYREAYHEFNRITGELERIRGEAARLKEDLEFMQFQFNELDAAHLKEGELETLEEEYQRAQHAEEIGHSLGQATVLLLQESTGILDRLSETLDQLKKISGVYATAGTIYERMESAYIELKDLAADVEQQAGKTELEPGKMEQLQERIDLLYGLMQKHRVREVAGLLALRDQLAGRIEDITFSDEKIHALEKERDLVRDRMEGHARRLHQQRTATGEEMQGKIEAQLKELGIPNARFRVDISSKKSFGPDGSDDIRFLFSANKQMALEEISKVASGGEISRLMLCIKALVSDRKGMPTLIFDEIDAGVSGEIAEKVGGIMIALSGGRQIVAITHLPQVASMGSEHFIVYKEDTDRATYTRIRKLDRDERITEIARMLSGESITEAALSNARVLLRV
jgi:DNA repair protein RecN (Recombination protein N)